MSTADHFHLAKLYEDPVECLHFSWPGPTAIEKDCVYFLDANVLLAPIALNDKNVVNLESIYDRLFNAGRLHCAAQAVREYIKRRPEMIGQMFNELHTTISKIPAVDGISSLFLDSTSEYRDLTDKRLLVERELKEYKKLLASMKTKLQDWGWDDKVSQLYKRVLTKETVHEYLPDSESEEKKFAAELERRIKYKIPPGYKDSSKPDGGSGDLIIWLTMLNYAKKNGRNVVFVTNEMKADWHIRSSDSAIMPRHELLYEFHKTTGKHFHILDFPTFLEKSGANSELAESVKGSHLHQIFAGEAKTVFSKLIVTLMDIRGLLEDRSDVKVAQYYQLVSDLCSQLRELAVQNNIAATIEERSNIDHALNCAEDIMHVLSTMLDLDASFSFRQINLSTRMRLINRIRTFTRRLRLRRIEI